MLPVGGPLLPVPADTILYHVYDDARREASEFNPVLMPLGRPLMGARFSGLLLAPDHERFHPYSSYYATWTRELAIREAIIRDNRRPHPTLSGAFCLDLSMFDERAIATVRVLRDFELVDIRGRTNQDFYDIDRFILHGVDYDLTRTVASELRSEHFSSTCGLVWRSNQDELADAVLLTGRPFLPTPAPPGHETPCYQFPADHGTSAVLTIEAAWAEASIEVIDSTPLYEFPGRSYVEAALPPKTYLL